MEKERSACERYVHELAERMKTDNLHGKVKRTHGSAKSEILRVAEEEKVGVISTGSRGLGTLRRTLLGSVRNHVLHHSLVPVLICKQHDDEHPHSEHVSKR